MNQKSLMKLAADLDVQFSSAKIISDHVRSEYDNILNTVIELVNTQAEDKAIWFMARTAPEAYLQQELRKLHAAIEGGLR